jgi:hypothetical protein
MLLSDFSCQPLLDRERASERWWRKKRDRGDGLMRGAEAIDPADSLRQAASPSQA